MKLTFYARVGQEHVRVPMKYSKYVPVENASYYEVRHGNQFQNIGRDFIIAVNKFVAADGDEKTRQGELGVPPEQRPLALAIELYLEEKRNKAPATVAQYKNTLSKFQSSCTKSFIDLIDRRDFTKFEIDMEKEGMAPRTRHDRLVTVMQMLKFNGKRFQKHEAPSLVKPRQRDVDAYTKEQLHAMLGKTKTERERLVLECFITTGVRDGELAHLRWMDITKNGFLIRSQTDWQTKTAESSRWVPVPDWLLRKLAAWNTGHTPINYVFPNNQNGSDEHLIRIAKDVAKRLGWKIQTKADPTGIRVDNHKFRATAITSWIRDGKSEREIRRWVGHKENSQTIARYYKHADEPDAQEMAASTFSEFAPKPQLVPAQKRAAGD